MIFPSRHNTLILQSCTLCFSGIILSSMEGIIGKTHVHPYIDFFIFVFLNLYSHASKLPRFITNGVKFWVKDLWKNKRLRSTQDEDKRNFSSRWSRLLCYQDVMDD